MFKQIVSRRIEVNDETQKSTLVFENLLLEQKIAMD